MVWLILAPPRPVHVPDPQPRAPPPHALFSVSLQAAAPASLLSVHLLPLTSPLAPLLESHLFPPAPGGDAFDLFAKPPEPAEPPEQEPSQPPSSAKSNSPVGKSRGSGQGPIWAGGDRDLSLPIAERQRSRAGQAVRGCLWRGQSMFPPATTRAVGLGCPVAEGAAPGPACHPFPDPVACHGGSGGELGHATPQPQPHRAEL